MSDYPTVSSIQSQDELIPISTQMIGGETVQSVDARTLHERLGIATAFNDWMRYQVESLDLIEDQDFLTFTQNSVKVGRPSVEYIVTVDCAKHLAMTCRNEKGRTVRQWFIDIEKRARLQVKSQVPPDYISALEAHLQSEKDKRAQALEIAEKNQLLLEAAPKVEFYDAVTESKDTCDMSEVAKVLGVRGMGRNKLFALLRDRKILRFNNQPYQEYLDRGYFKVIEQKSEHKDGSARITFKTEVYQKGLDFIRKQIATPGLEPGTAHL